MKRLSVASISALIALSGQLRPTWPFVGWRPPTHETLETESLKNGLHLERSIALFCAAQTTCLSYLNYNSNEATCVGEYLARSFALSLSLVGRQKLMLYPYVTERSICDRGKQTETRTGYVTIPFISNAGFAIDR